MKEAVMISVAIFLVLTPSLLFAMQRAVRNWEHRFRDPFSEGLLRPPGTGCLEEAEERRGDMLSLCALMSGMLPALAIAVIVSRSYAVTLCLLGIVLIVTALGSWRVYHHTKKARIARMGYLGELAVAEVLSQLPTEDGWKVFHDVRFDAGNGRLFNVDHIVIGPSGIYAIETKAKSPVREKISGGDVVTVNGDRIEFPDGRVSSRPIRQARKNAKFMHRWLKSEIGVDQFVIGYVVLPGWDAKYACGKRNTRICSAKNLVGFLQRESGELGSTEREMIVGLLDAHCRDLSFEHSDNFLSAYHHDARVRSKPVTVT